MKHLYEFRKRSLLNQNKRDRMAFLKSQRERKPLSDFTLFENLPEIIRPRTAASVLGISVKTIYDWHYRGKLRNVPGKMFLKMNRLLYLRTDVLRSWISSQNPSLF